MKHTLVLLTVAFASMALVASAAEGDIVEWIVNGDFETGDFTGWTGGTNDTKAVINDTSPISGSYSANVTTHGSGDFGLLQEGFGIVSNATVKFDFKVDDPGGATDRGLQVQLSAYAINMRVVDGSVLDDGLGDFEIFQGGGSGWMPVLTDVVVFGASNAVTITINGYGGAFDYDLVVNGVAATGLSYIQTGTFSSLDFVSFRGGSSTVGFTVDNVSVVGPVPPLPPPPPPEGLANGDFEADPFDLYWSGIAPSAVSGLVAGSTTAADLNGTMWQDFITEAGDGTTGDGGLTNGFVFDVVVSLDDLNGGLRIRLRGGNDYAANDIITLKMDSSGLYSYVSPALYPPPNGWQKVVPFSVSAGTACHIRITVPETNDSMVYGLSADGINYTESSEWVAAHGLLTRGFETVGFEGNMIVDDVSVDDGSRPPATPVTVAISVLDLTDEVEISWVATNQLSYTVEASSNLAVGAAGWYSITSNVPGINGEVSITDPIDNDQLFYRVITGE